MTPDMAEVKNGAEVKFGVGDRIGAESNSADSTNGVDAVNAASFSGLTGNSATDAVRTFRDLINKFE